MNNAVKVAQITARAAGITLLILGIVFWTGHALQLIPLHQGIGIVLVLAMLTLAGIGVAAGAGRGIVAIVVVWAIVMPMFGVMQTRIMPGGAHWVIQVLHLVVGVVALRLSEQLGAAIRGARPAAAA